MHFHCSRIDNTTQQRPFPSDGLRIKPSHEFPPSFQTCASCRVLHNVQCLSFQKLCQCNVDLRIDFDRIGTGFDIVNVQYWCPVEPAQSRAISRRWDHGCCHVLELESPILPRRRFGAKVRQVGECSRLDKCSVSSGCPVVRLDFRPGHNICSIPVPAFQHVRQLSLQRNFLSQLSLLADFPTSSTIAVSLAVESSTAAGGSSQLAP